MRLWCRLRFPEDGCIRNIWSNKFPLREYADVLPDKSKITVFEKLWMTLLLLRTYCSLGYLFRGIILTDKTREQESQLIEFYVSVFHWIPLLCLLTFHPFFYSYLKSHLFLDQILWVLVLYLVLGSVLLPLRIVFVDRYKKNWKPHTFNRSLLFVFLNYLEIIVGFACLYLYYGLVGHSKCAYPISTIWDALYFSVVTITTLGYGDIRPITWQGKALASFEPLMGTTLLVVIVGLFFVELGRQKTSKKNK